MSIESADEAEEYYVVPEEALQFLPEEWRNHFRAMADNHRAVLRSGDKELSQIIRVAWRKTDGVRWPGSPSDPCAAPRKP
jgi:hypothetical protein